MINENIKMEFKFDYYSVTFPLSFDIDEIEEIAVEEKVELIAGFFNLEERLIKKEPKPTNRYKYQYTLGESIILRLVGPEDSFGFKTCHLELKGEGCREFESRCPNKTWFDLMTFCNMLDCKATRLDTAIDDFSNQINLEWLDKKLRNKYYTSSIISKPKPIGTLDSGMSLNLGNNDSPIQICIYDKKFEQQEKNRIVLEDSWTRYEMRYRGNRARSLYSMLYKEFRLNKDNINQRFKEICFSLLYKNLDIKEDNNYTTANQKRVPTDKKWLRFIQNAEKAVLPPLIKKELSYESYIKRHTPTVAFYLTFLFIRSGENPENFEMELYNTMYEQLTLNKKKFHRLNLYLDKLGLKTKDDKDIELLRDKLFDIKTDRELPF